MTNDSMATHGSWQFIDDQGTFQWKNPPNLNDLYFPLCNESGVMSSVTPALGGDLKTSQNTFLLQPVSIEDLHNNRSSRNFWIHSDRTGPYSLTGNSARQNAATYTDDVGVELIIRGGLLWHQLLRTDDQYGLKIEITSFAPIDPVCLEVMWVKITNLASEPLKYTPTAAVPIFGRSAENIRDHKHATSLNHQVQVIQEGVVVKPAIFHDERGHKPNKTSYFVAGFSGDGEVPVGVFPTVRDYVGKQGSYDWPHAVVQNLDPEEFVHRRQEGLEMIGALRFHNVVLRQDESHAYQILLGVVGEQDSASMVVDAYRKSEQVQRALDANREHWNNRVDRVKFELQGPDFSNWLRWVVCQPTLRKIFGCSFLPHHDYGKGGRGWRDLWQDSLALLLQDPNEQRQPLADHFFGVRADGTNATIIGKGRRQFAADRNNISRVWMDHGVWPCFTVQLYIDQTSDVDILFDQADYWHDHQIHRAREIDRDWQPEDGAWARTADGDVYSGSILEHLLVQLLTCFFHVGEHNNLRLEDADWNDQLDMAPDRGESVAFSAFYAGNLVNLAKLLRHVKEQKGIGSVTLATELAQLIDTTGDVVDYDSPRAKNSRLDQYLCTVEKGFSGKQEDVALDSLIDDLERKGTWLSNYIHDNEWIEVDGEAGFFNGYYNNDAQRVDGVFSEGVRMNLTGQTFTTMFGIASDEQVDRGFRACSRYLVDPQTKGFRLTTPLGPNTFNFGRGFALVYGEKENGAMFSHMAVMYANALYRRGFVREGYQVLSSIYDLCTDTKKAEIYPGIPEYISFEGKGMYHYLTGSSSWLVMTMLTQVFGFRGDLGDLVITPKLVAEQFSASGVAAVTANFAGRRIRLRYENRNQLDWADYVVREVLLDDEPFSNFVTLDKGKGIRISRSTLESGVVGSDCRHLTVVLDRSF